MSDLYRIVPYDADQDGVDFCLARMLETGVLVKVEPNYEAVAGLLAAAYMGVPLSAEQIVHAALEVDDLHDDDVTLCASDDCRKPHHE